MINNFREEYEFLSNFHLCQIEFEGLIYPSTENAYQSAKTLDLTLRKKFVNISPAKSKKLGKSVKIRDDWEKFKLKIMEDLLRKKFDIPYLKEKLLLTGEKLLVESNNWNDQYWGVCNGKGKNHLGKLLMQIRQKFLFNDIFS